MPSTDASPAGASSDATWLNATFRVTVPRFPTTSLIVRRARPNSSPAPPSSTFTSTGPV